MKLRVNGKEQTVREQPGRSLLETLREDLGITGVKYGCGEGQCRACTVLLDGKPVTSCLTPVRLAAGKSVTTIEALANGDSLHPVQQAFIDEGAMQCGYCVPGMILRTVSLLREKPRPAGPDIEAALNGNLCRCCGYPDIVAAVRRASTLAAKENSDADRA